MHCAFACNSCAVRMAVDMVFFFPSSPHRVPGKWLFATMFSFRINHEWDNCFLGWPFYSFGTKIGNFALDFSFPLVLQIAAIQRAFCDAQNDQLDSIFAFETEQNEIDKRISMRILSWIHSTQRSLGLDDHSLDDGLFCASLRDSLLCPTEFVFT